MALRRLGMVALAAGFSTLSLSIAVPSTMAAPDNSTAVISEVYGGGGNKGASFSHDFIELYNPTDTAIDLTGWSVEYFASTGNSGGKITLSGTIAPHGYYLVQGAAGNGQSQALPTPDAEGKVAMSSTNGSVQLADATGTTIDLVGYGAASKFEGSATGALSNDTSASRNAAGADTDDNLADFTVGTPSPTNSGNESPATQLGGSGDSENLPAPEGITPIVEIQGTGDASPPSMARTLLPKALSPACGARVV